MGSVESKEITSQKDDESTLFYLAICSIVIGFITVYFILRKKGKAEYYIGETRKEEVGDPPDGLISSSKLDLADGSKETGKDGNASEFCVEEQEDLRYELIRTPELEQPGRSRETDEEDSSDVYSLEAESETDSMSSLALAESEFDHQTASEEWEDQPLKKCEFPHSLRVSDVMSDSVTLKWVGIEEFDAENSYYQVRFKEPSQKRWTAYQETSEIDCMDIKGLKSDCSYIFQVRVVIDDEEGKYSDPTEEVKTKKSLAAQLLEFCTKVKDAEPSTYEVNCTEIIDARDSIAKTRKMEIGTPNKIGNEEKTILLVGATGSGKSTLVDGIINFVAGVNWNDPYRFKLVSLEKEEQQNIKNQAVSQTEWISTYTIHPAHGNRLKYTLNIIDTPGFGDTRGIDRDREIIKQLKQLFSSSDANGVVTLDAVCFIVKAPDARLTHSQKYVFMQILSLFGQNIEENIMYLITFTDGETPPVLAAMKEAELPAKNHFVFNNSGLFAPNTEGKTGLSPMFWEMGINSFRTFFDSLRVMTPKSLSQTKEVLNERERISVTIADLRQKVDMGLCKLSDLERDIEQLEKHENDIADNKDFIIESTETKQVEEDIPSGTYITNCLQCNKTCHYPCAISDDFKKGCGAMDGNGNCRICSKGCSYTQHRNGRKRLNYVQVKVKTTKTQMEAAYKQAGEKKLSVEEIIQRKQIEIGTIFDVVLQLMKNVNEANNRLKEIALRPDPLTMVEHIDLMIQSEKDEMKPGYLDRIKVLQRYRKEVDIGKHFSNLSERMKKTDNLMDKRKKGFWSRACAKAAKLFDIKY